MPQTLDAVTWHADVWQLWAKSGEDGKWLSVPQHMRDSAAVAGLLWDHWASDSLRQLLATESSLEPAGVRLLLQWLAGVHDVGKIDSEFIRQIEHQSEYVWLVDRARGAGLDFKTKHTPHRVPHSHISDALVAEYLSDQAGLPLGKARTYSAVVGSHHGLPMPIGDRDRATQHVQWLSAQWQELQQNALAVMAAETGFDQLLDRLPRALSTPAQMVLTGLVIMTDWIASNADACPLTSDGRDDSAGRAEEALSHINPTTAWVPAPPQDKAEGAFHARFNWTSSRHTRPVQALAHRLALSLPQGQSGLMVVEAPMGEGKTELALLCAEIMAAKNGSGGIMVATPTMATADGLLRRIGTWAEAAMAQGLDIASLMLAHSKSHLNTQFRNLPRLKDIHDSAGAVVAHEWLSGRKKGILANAVVGTVDQVLFMALQSKHMMLRHLGLAQKVVIIDEVHAYDSYMSHYMERALTWLGHYRTPVILLSATLPHSRKEQLSEAYLQGLRGRKEVVTLEHSDSSYPVITLVQRSDITAHAAAPSGREQKVDLCLLEEGDAAMYTALQQTAAEGGCTAVVCSTVDRAQRVFEIAKELVHDDAVLLHSRFTASERVAKEAVLLDELGSGASRGAGTRPHRRVVVATQVIEQSLDVDFDHMITDIAPSDLVLQRIGRLHRHHRPENDRPTWAQTPTVSLRGLLSPPTAEAPPVFDDLVSLIYPEHLLLASCTALGLLSETPRLALPTEIPQIVHATYEEPATPESWRERSAQAWKSYKSSREEAENRAKSFKVDPPRPGKTLSHLFGQLADDVDRDDWGEQRGLSQVRDTDPTLEVLLVEKTPHGYRPLPWLLDEESAEIHDGMEPSWATAQILASSSVRLPRHFSKTWVFAEAIETLEAETDVAWRRHPLLRGQVMLRLDEGGETTLLGRRLRYDQELGLIDMDARRGGPSPSKET